MRMTSRHSTTGIGGGGTVRPICVRRRQRQTFPTSVDIRGLDEKSSGLRCTFHASYVDP